MAAATKTKADPALRVCVLGTHVGENLIIGSNPTVDEVRGFVKEHLRRYHAGEAGGPSGNPAYKILSATFYESAEAFHEGKGKLEEVDISDLDPMNR